MIISGAEVQASGSSVLVTLAGHVDELPTRLVNPRLVTSEEFTLTMQGIRLTQALNASFPSGQVANVTSEGSGPNTVVTIHLRTSATNQNVAAGAGAEIDIMFS